MRVTNSGSTRIPLLANAEYAVTISFTEGFLEQQLRYSRTYSALTK